MIGETAPRRWRIVVDLLAVVSLCALIIGSWALATRFQASNAARENNQRVWHAVICQIEGAVTKNKKLTEQERTAALRFYDRLLVEDVQTTPCGLVTGR